MQVIPNRFREGFDQAAAGQGAGGFRMSGWVPCLERRALGESGVEVRLGHDLLDDYLRFVAGRCRPNSVLAAGFDLKVFFGFVGEQPAEVTTADVLEFIVAQRSPLNGGNVVRLADGEAGLSARTIRRRLATLSGLFGYLIARGVVKTSPVPSGPLTRSPNDRGRRSGRLPLIRTPRTLPRVLAPAEAVALLAALRTARDRAMAEAMLLGGLRRCEVLGLRLEDVQAVDRRLLIAEGKGGHQRIVPVAGRFFTTLTTYLEQERPKSDTSQVFVVLKGPSRGRPLTAAGIDEILRGARRRAGLERATCHMLRRTCLTRLREAGMALEAVQAQAGHCSIESTRIYLHLADSWPAKEYHKAMDALEADLPQGGER
ncbi:Site-specific recombinase XerD [Sinosporangium album]|uniref:Site-specific recombinase XerD n=1 Tax=Sinosporangium album TaxID=504805 RepID=A0A1G8ILU1_9ACTN|nr:tyrosine-type recombinase/integrase [Sinosporangium album]SDI19884.1 Site-specific recombinase XerD [Sinosporangium album]